MSDNNKKIGWLSKEISPRMLRDSSLHRGTRLTVARLGAEVVSIAMLPLTTAIGRTFFPHQLDELEHKIAKTIVAPNLENIERYADRFTALEGEEGIEKRHKMTNEEKADYFAHALVMTALPAAFSLLAQGYTQDKLDHHFGLPELAPTWGEKSKKLAFSVGIDKAVQMGSFIALNTPNLGQGANLSMQRSIAEMLQKLPGIDKDGSETAARWTTNWIVPNFIGMGASITSLDKAYAKVLKELVEKESTSLGK